MVKGISRQVIVIHSPDPKLFEEAIFILKDDAVRAGGVTEDLLMREANRLIQGNTPLEKVKYTFRGPVWAMAGAAFTAVVWMVSTLL